MEVLVCICNRPDANPFGECRKCKRPHFPADPRYRAARKYWREVTGKGKPKNKDRPVPEPQPVRKITHEYVDSERARRRARLARLRGLDGQDLDG